MRTGFMNLTQKVNVFVNVKARAPSVYPPFGELGSRIDEDIR